jgi:hypothetical protein
MKPRRHNMLDFHPASVVGSLMGGDPYEGPATTDARPEVVSSEPSAFGRVSAALRRRRERAASWARAQTGRVS